jgi:hypothetical protein
MSLAKLRALASHASTSLQFSQILFQKQSDSLLTVFVSEHGYGK